MQGRNAQNGEDRFSGKMQLPSMEKRGAFFLF
jgi:hypothetical protein